MTCEEPVRSYHLGGFIWPFQRLLKGFEHVGTCSFSKTSQKTQTTIKQQEDIRKEDKF